MKFLTPLLIPAAAILATTAAAPLMAQTAAPLPSIAVQTGDLNLANGADRERLERRLYHAARELCGTGFGFDLRSQVEARQCIDDTVASVRIPAPPTDMASAE